MPFILHASSYRKHASRNKFFVCNSFPNVQVRDRQLKLLKQVTVRQENSEIPIPVSITQTKF
jgi:hypothetical protein